MSGVSANPRSCSPNHSQPAVPAFAAPHNRSAPGSRRALAILTPEGSCYAVHDSRPGLGKLPPRTRISALRPADKWIGAEAAGDVDRPMVEATLLGTRNFEPSNIRQRSRGAKTREAC